MKTLYLLRHAKAEPGHAASADFDRPLMERGKRDAAAMGHYMALKHYAPQRAFYSPSLRTAQTLHLTEEAAGGGWYSEIHERLYLAGVEDIMQCVRGFSDATDAALIVGHNPGMHRSAIALSKAGTGMFDRLELDFPTCTLAAIALPVAQWSALTVGSGSLVDFYTARADSA